MSVVAVVGVGPGIGLAVALRFAREGFKVALLARNVANLATYEERVRAAGSPEVKAFPVDVSNAEELKKSLAAVAENLGEPTVLVYNAALWREGLPSIITFSQFIEDFKVNVAGALVATQAVLPAMERQAKGTLLFTGGGLAFEPYAEVASLAVGKSALRSLVLSLAQELNPKGIHVATVTVCGLVKEGTHFDPAKIADVYWKLHQQEKDHWDKEVVYK